jgi:hypothetical protein
MNDRFIYLLENYFDNNLSEEENKELINLINSNKTLQTEFEEQKRIKEVLSKMSLKNPSREAWDNYWLGIYNRLERGIAWIILSVGAVIVLSFITINIVEGLLETNNIPLFYKAGIFLLMIGVVILFVSVVREKFFTYKNDKYKEIQR